MKSQLLEIGDMGYLEPGPVNRNIRVERFSSIAAVPPEVWNGGMTLPTPMQHKFLELVEKSGINNLRHWNLRMTTAGAELARANIFLSDTDFSTFDAKLPASARLTIKRWSPNFMTFKVLECGYFTMIGEGMVVREALAFREALRTVSREMDRIADEENADFLLIRDVPMTQYEAYHDILRPLGYYPILGFPNAVLPVCWDSLDGYLAALNSKTRLKFRNSLKLKEKFDIDVEFTRDYAEHAATLAILWENVHRNAKDYSREFLDQGFFAHSASVLHENSEVLLFRHRGKIIAFMLNLYGADEYIVLDWGVDYSFEQYREANLYRAATVLSLQRAIELGKTRMELGITNYTPKMTLGAEIVPLVYFVRHRDNPRYSKTLAKLLSANIAQPDTGAHDALSRTGAERVDLQEIETRIKRDQCNIVEHDLFSKVDKYHRADSMRLAGIYGLYPEFRTAQDSCISLGEKQNVVLLGTNSYLGLATHPDVVSAAMRALEKYGTGCSGSPLLNGTLDVHRLLEEELADFLRREAVILCSTGYQTNLAGLSALCGPGDCVLMDARNHRSLFDGVRLSGADCLVYRHNDMAHLKTLLARTSGRRRIVVTDSLFSMEGTVADLRTICRLVKEFNARVFVDESHAIGVLGPGGRGVCELLGVESEVDLVMGTFSKSFAAIGGFLAGNHDVIDFIKHNAGGHIFSASLPASIVETVRAVLRIVRNEPERRVDILHKARFMATSLADLGYQAHYHGSQIVPVVLGSYTLALAAYCRFMEHGVYVNPVGPPAVPEEASGFRTSYIATHQWSDLERALEVFARHRSDFEAAPAPAETVS